MAVLSVCCACSSDVNDPDANTCIGNTYSLPVQVHYSKGESNTVVKIVADQVHFERTRSSVGESF